MRFPRVGGIRGAVICHTRRRESSPIGKSPESRRLGYRVSAARVLCSNLSLLARIVHF